MLVLFTAVAVINNVYNNVYRGVSQTSSSDIPASEGNVKPGNELLSPLPDSIIGKETLRESKGYIIQLKDPPILLFEKAAMQQAPSQSVQAVQSSSQTGDGITGTEDGITGNGDGITGNAWKIPFAQRAAPAQGKLQSSADIVQRHDSARNKILLSVGAAILPAGSSIATNAIGTGGNPVPGKTQSPSPTPSPSSSHLPASPPELPSSTLEFPSPPQQEPAEPVLLGDYVLAFNGFGLEISDAQAAELAKLQEVKGVFPNLMVQADLFNSGGIIGADKVWLLDEDGNNCAETEKACLTGKGVTIGIIDTGVDYLHADLGGCLGEGCKVIGGYDFINQDEDPIDDHGHGTHVAATAAGNGLFKGIAPDANIVAYKVLNENGNGFWSDVLSGIERGVDPNKDGNTDDKLDVISLSLGGDCAGDYSKFCGPDDPISTAIDNVVDAGIVAVIAAGNSGPEKGTIGTPATSRKAITVGAIGKYHDLPYFSSRGPVVVSDTNEAIIKPDVVAPGTYICAALSSQHVSYFNELCVDRTHLYLSGTSMAAPHVSGLAALLRQKNPDWKPEDIKMAIRQGSTDYGYQIYEQGWGMVDAVKSMMQKEPLPIARISTNGEKLGIIDIFGSAFGNGFAFYTLEYSSSDNSDGWNILINSSTSIEGGALFNDFDTLAHLSQGENYLRLRVYNNAGEFSEEKSLLIFEPLILNAVGLKGYLNGNGMSLASWEDKIEAESLSVEYRKGPSSSSGSQAAGESESGSELGSSMGGSSMGGSSPGGSSPGGSSKGGGTSGGSSSQKELWVPACQKVPESPDGDSCEFDETTLQNGLYYFRARALKNGREFFSKEVKASVIRELKDGWPAEFNGFPRDPINFQSKGSDKRIINNHFENCFGRFSDSARNREFNPDSSLIAFSGSIVKDVPIAQGFQAVRRQQGSANGAASEQSASGNGAVIIGLGNLSSKGWVSCNGNEFTVFNSNGESNSFSELRDSAGNYHELPWGDFPALYQTPEGGNYLAAPSSYESNGFFDFGGLLYNTFEERIVGWLFEIAQNKIWNVATFYGSGSSIILKLFGYSIDGKSLSNFPVDVFPVNQGRDNWGIFYRLLPHVFPDSGTEKISAAFGNFSVNDGRMEKLSLYHNLYNLDGKLLKSVNFLNHNGRFQVYLASTAADLNGDGRREVALTVSILDIDLYEREWNGQAAYKTKTFFFDANGDLHDTSSSSEGDIVEGSIIADFGKPYVVLGMVGTFSTGFFKIKAFDFNGTKKFETDLPDYNNILTGLASGDVDGDGVSEVIVSYRPRWWKGGDSGILIYDSNGILEREIKVTPPGQLEEISNPIIADFNNDGKTDIIMQSLFVADSGELSTRIFVFELGTPFNAQKMDWPMVLHDPQHTTCYDCDKALDACVDTDGDDAYTLGNVSFGGDTFYDACASPKEAREMACVRDSNGMFVKGAKTVKCPQGCFDGKCRSYCKDSDGDGEDGGAFTKGYVESNGVLQSDSCATATEVVERYCSKPDKKAYLKTVLDGNAYSYRKSCPTSCSNGACDNRVYFGGFETNDKTSFVYIDDTLSGIARTRVMPEHVWGLTPGASIYQPSGEPDEVLVTQVPLNEAPYPLTEQGKQKKNPIPATGAGAIQVVPVKAGKKYTISVSAKAWGKKGITPVLSVFALNSQKQMPTLTTTGYLVGFPKGKWATKSTTVTAPKNTAYFLIRLTVGREADQTAYWDDVKVEEVK